VKSTLSPNRPSHSRGGSLGPPCPLDRTADGLPTDFRNVSPQHWHFYHSCVSGVLRVWTSLDGISLFVRTVTGQRLPVLGNQIPMAGYCEVPPNSPFKSNPGKTDAFSHWIALHRYLLLRLYLSHRRISKQGQV
jgi:hypothetical protein